LYRAFRRKIRKFSFFFVKVMEEKKRNTGLKEK